MSYFEDNVWSRLPGAEGIVSRAESHTRQRLGTRADVEFFVNVADVSVDGGHADVQRLGNFLVEVAAGQEVEHFAFARG